MNTGQSTDGAGTECVRSEYGAQYGRSGGRSTYGVGMEQTRDGVGAQGVSRYGM